MMFILAITFYFYTISSMVIFIYLLIKNPKVFEPAGRYLLPWFFYPMIIGVFITLCYVLFFGFKNFLHFIPYSWGSYTDGEWHAVRDSIYAALAFLATYYFLYLVGEVQRKEGMIKKLKRKNQKKALMLNGSWDCFSEDEKKLLSNDGNAWPSDLQKKVSHFLGE